MRPVIGILFAFHLLSPPARALSLIAFCRAVAAVVSGFTAGPSSAISNPAILKALPTLIAEFQAGGPARLEANRKIYSRYDREISDKLTLSGQPVDTLCYLGSGLEADAFLTKSTPPTVIKHYRSKEQMLKNANALKELEENGIPTAKILTVDPDSNNLVMEYRPGVNVNYLLSSTLSPTQKARILDAFYVFAAEYEQKVRAGKFSPEIDYNIAHSKGGLPTKNVVLTTEGKFVIIDPH